MEDHDPLNSELNTDKLTPEMQEELDAYAKLQEIELGLKTAHWVEPVHTEFVASQRATTTIWVSGLSLAHDEMVAAALIGLGYI